MSNIKESIIEKFDYGTIKTVTSATCNRFDKYVHDTIDEHIANMYYSKGAKHYFLFLPIDMYPYPTRAKNYLKTKYNYDNIEKLTFYYVLDKYGTEQCLMEMQLN